MQLKFREHSFNLFRSLHMLFSQNCHFHYL